MKIYTLGMHGMVPLAIAAELGLHGSHQQAEVLTAASSKAKAFAILAEFGLAPGSVHDSEFRVAQGKLVEALLAAGLFTEGTVLITHLSRVVGPVIRMAAHESYRVIGETVLDGRDSTSPVRFVRASGIGFFHSTAAGPVQLPASAVKEVGEVYAGLKANREEIAAITRRQEELRRQRHELCARAVELEAVAGTAAVLDVSPGRVYQMSDAHQIDTASRRRPAAPTR